ncbi:hypothetical protein AOQ84DRAFT_116689 [Glonium stellatum]|uniref:Uncharacterized protein n=1 Tax=Glonium stellatum TaxID=574774 RepID=A0A8E2FB86_9PEZI|nr:hypothetical protein AOQ84DRAFT_116689 [Glonium stellatum]
MTGSCSSKSAESWQIHSIVVLLHSPPRHDAPLDRSTRHLDSRASSAAVVPGHEGRKVLALRREVQCRLFLPAAGLQSLSNVSAYVRAGLDYEGPYSCPVGHVLCHYQLFALSLVY